jgi:hypothetical protein
MARTRFFLVGSMALFAMLLTVAGGWIYLAARPPKPATWVEVAPEQPGALEQFNRVPFREQIPLAIVANEKMAENWPGDYAGSLSQLPREWSPELMAGMLQDLELTENADRGRQVINFIGNLHHVSASMLCDEYRAKTTLRFYRSFRQADESPHTSDAFRAEMKRVGDVLAAHDLAVVLPYHGQSLDSTVVRQLRGSWRFVQWLNDGGLVVENEARTPRRFVLRWLVDAPPSGIINATEAKTPVVCLFCGKTSIVTSDGSRLTLDVGYALSWPLLRRHSLLQGRDLLDDVPSNGPEDPLYAGELVRFIQQVARFAPPESHQPPLNIYQKPRFPQSGKP